MFNPPPPAPEEQDPAVKGPKPMSPEGFLRAYRFATDRLADGATEWDVRHQLRAAGLDREATESVLDDVANLSPTQRRLSSWNVRAHQLAMLAERRTKARSNVMVGGLVMVIGLAVTVVSFAAAASRMGGGTYVLAWGAILFGGLRMVMGMSEVARNR